MGRRRRAWSSRSITVVSFWFYWCHCGWLSSFVLLQVFPHWAVGTPVWLVAAWRGWTDGCVVDEGSSSFYLKGDPSANLGHPCLFLSSCCLVTQSCLTLCDSMDCSTPGFPVLHHLLEFAQTHAHWVSDAIQPSHPLSSSSPPALNLSQQQVFFFSQWVSSSNQVAKVYWSFSFSISPSNKYSGLISFRID